MAEILQTGRKHSGKGEIVRYENFSISHNAIERPVLQTSKIPGFYKERVADCVARVRFFKF